MIVKDLEAFLDGPLTITSGCDAVEFERYGDIPAEWLVRAIDKLRAVEGRLVIEVRNPHSTRTLEAHGYEFEVGF